eukprot:CAMPEP_0172480604 /NCGR_PEP_ID=MMETSP1066-20121228/5891_1 /TAXON_ID=671091 /ORGANISM="Coscinodiscus wailesii, Strain CCMP2513" /LENGTH=304 /DNA_ID=CAMNT_0013242101 /DNA_START=322 /DNA_END=1237 /DNA_ORIENTATION=+
MDDKKLAPLQMSDLDDSSGGEGAWNTQFRQPLSIVSAVGMVETAYLTFTKLTTKSVLFCGDDGGGCGDVLNSPYATIHFGSFDVPLPLLGFLAYTSVFLLLQSTNQTITRNALLFLTTSMATFSIFLVSILTFILHASCPYCLLSALLSLTLGFSWFFVSNDDDTTDFRFGVGGAVASTFAAVALYLSAPASAVTASNAAPAITTDSTEQSLVVAKSLSDLNARMYGAFWCSHCYDQKQAFGKEAFQKYISYIECDKEGLNNQRSLCKEKDVPGYPTWEINGKLYPGERSLEELQELLGEIVNK